MIKIPTFARKNVKEISQTKMPNEFFNDSRYVEISKRIEKYSFLPNRETRMLEKFYDDNRPVQTQTMKTKFQFLGGEKFLRKIKQWR
jgi:hypothetical protein